MACPPGSHIMQSSGVTVRETKKLMISAKEMVSASGRKRLRAIPKRNRTGKNTTMVVMVDTRMGMATSWAAASTACLRPWPIARWRWMFSSSTIESSTSRPTPSASPPSVNTLRVCPEKKSSTKVATMLSGIATATMPVARSETRNTRITSTARIPPCTASCSSALTEARM